MSELLTSPRDKSSDEIVPTGVMLILTLSGEEFFISIRNDNIVTDAAIRESKSRIFKNVFFELCFFIVTPW